MAKEIEAKYLEVDRTSLISRLEAVGAIQEHPETLLKRRTYTLGNGKSVRVRREGDGRITCTAKYEDKSLGVLSLDEYEVEVSDYHEMCSLLHLLYPDTPYGDQESRREKWKLDSSEITIDTWPGVPTFVEIESPSVDELTRISELLGYDITTALYGRVS